LSHFKALKPALQKPSKVRELDLSGQNLQKLPAELQRLQHLEALNLSNNPALGADQVGQFLAHWPALERLIWTDCKLTELPDSLMELPRLQHLHLDNNRLEALPPTLVHCPELMHLTADWNHLQQLPDSFNQLGQLRFLSLRYNAFAEMPSVLLEMPGLLNCQFKGNLGKKKRQALTPRFAERFYLYSL
jgi:Leucine-rich repeat (LRR) protein